MNHPYRERLSRKMLMFCSTFDYCLGAVLFPFCPSLSVGYPKDSRCFFWGGEEGCL
ncbi:hypothetical protein BCR39DRAFT_539324 [Naematelia encephala]|uniref:Uncharacterized protein n=1 Tax=Naematelia encephala TaxID=71784 RepID=A0A1Y2AX99_9TREE|nr:hypothetical protein BCR39DRAFT_539324 [Naematelia encephala]